MSAATCNASEDPFVLCCSVDCLAAPRLRSLQAVMAAFVGNSVLRIGGVGLRAITLLTGMFIASIVLVSEALAEPEVYKFGRHKLQLVKDDDDIGKRLLLDGKAIIENWSVTIEKRAIVGGVPVVFGESQQN